jgi:hypothetical protein
VHRRRTRHRHRFASGLIHHGKAVTAKANCSYALLSLYFADELFYVRSMAEMQKPEMALTG